MSTLTPREIVAELDKFVVGQEQAKRMVAVAVRNRWRRQHLPELSLIHIQMCIRDRGPGCPGGRAPCRRKKRRHRGRAWFQRYRGGGHQRCFCRDRQP